MRTFIIFLVILLVFFGLAIWNSWYLNKSSRELAEEAEKVRLAVHEENWDNAGSQVMKIRRMWGKHKKVWLILVDHDDIDDIDRTIYRIDELVKQNDKEQSLADIAELRFYLHDLADKESMSLANIF